MEAGRRMITLERCFNAMLGYTRKDDVLPYRLMNEVQHDAMHENAINSEQMLDIMKDEYFALHEWDIETGIPTKATLEKLGLGEFIDKITGYIQLK